MMNFQHLLLALLLAPAVAFNPRGFKAPSRRAVLSEVLKEPKSDMKITLMAGDGIGPEITEATVKVLNKLAELKDDVNFTYDEALIGGAALDAKDDPFPAETLASCRASDSVLLACIGGPKWDGNSRDKRPETGLLAMRKSMDLFANLRPAKVLPQLIDASTLKREIVEGVDIMVIRELTGDVYFGEPKGITTDEKTGERTGFNNMIYRESEIERIARVAFDVAGKRRGQVCSIDKANVLDVSQLWKDVVIGVHGKDYKDIELSHMYVDNAAMQLIRWPKQFDTILCGNIFGDILSDEASMLVGSLGMLPSASMGNPDTPGVFEPCHGSAPDIAGQDKANPLAMILSAAMMLRYDLCRPAEADLLEAAVEKVLDDNLRTADIYQEGKGETLLGCKAMGDAVAAALESLC